MVPANAAVTTPSAPVEQIALPHYSGQAPAGGTLRAPETLITSCSIALPDGNTTLNPLHSKTFAILLVLGFAAGCSSNVTLEEATIPTPLTDRMPVTVGLRMPADFYSFVHEEQVYGREEWSINLGDANASLFQQLFGHMFQTVKILGEEDDPEQMGIDALIEPSIDAFEFSVPAQSKTDSFAVWVRYRLRVYDRDGNLVSNWPVSAYGKSQTEGGNSASLQRAAVLAMRDAAALIIMKLDSATGIGSLAEARPARPVPGITPGPADGADESGLQTTALEGPTDEPG